MKKIFGLLLALAMLLALTACGQSAPAPTVEPSAEPEPTEAPAESEAAEGEASGLVFSTTDRDGEVWDQNSLRDHTLIMLNFWEPWCPPCVAEMPDLEKLYQDYAEQGFLILGVYSTPGVEDDVVSVLSEAGVSYPILHYCSAFDPFQSGYVPTTVFLNAAGELVGKPYVGSRDYADWAEIVEGLL